MSNDISTVLLELRPIQDKIIKSGTENIMDRWEFGKLLVEVRGDKKQLPDGMRADIADAFHMEASEITRRMQLADKFNTEAEVRDACTRCGGSWRRIIREELIKRRDGQDRKKNAWGEPKKATLKRWLEEVNGDDTHHDELLALLQATVRAMSDVVKAGS
jgi:hypothetical protein